MQRTGAYPTNDSRDLGETSCMSIVVILELLLFTLLPNCKAMLTWGFTDRYSWVPIAELMIDRGAASAFRLDCICRNEPTGSMQQVMARVVS